MTKKLPFLWRSCIWQELCWVTDVRIAPELWQRMTQHVWLRLQDCMSSLHSNIPSWQLMSEPENPKDDLKCINSIVINFKYNFDKILCWPVRLCEDKSKCGKCRDTWAWPHSTDTVASVKGLTDVWPVPGMLVWCQVRLECRLLWLAKCTGTQGEGAVSQFLSGCCFMMITVKYVLELYRVYCVKSLIFVKTGW